MNFEIAKGILESEAERQGLKEYEIYYTASEGLNAETLKDEISSFSSGNEAGISFRCIAHGHVGSAATELFDEDELKALVARAAANASVIENDEPAIIFEGSEEYAQKNSTVLDMPSVADVKKLALDLQKKTYETNELVTDGTQAGVFANISSYELVNSKGLRLSNKIGFSGAFVQAVVNKDGEASDGFDYTVGLEKAEELPAKAVEESMSKLGAKTVESGKYPIIIDGKQMRALLSTFCSVFSGKKVLQGLSLLAGKEGEIVASDSVTVIDDPQYEASPVQTTFDGEGVATYKKNVIENGVLKTLLYDLATAQRAGVKTTANGQRGSYAQQVSIEPFCFYIKEGDLTEDELRKKMGDGLYVTELKGLHAGANAITGDFSIESAGFLVKDGRLVGAVKGFTVAGNFFELLKNIVAVADTVKFGMPSGFTTFGSPDVLIAPMSVAGE